MTFLISLILKILGTTFVISLLAILVERVLIINGFTQGSTISIIVATFILVTLFRLAYPGDPMYPVWLFLVFLGPIGMNRYELTMTMKYGRWWWKKENLSTELK